MHGNSEVVLHEQLAHDLLLSSTHNIEDHWFGQVITVGTLRLQVGSDRVHFQSLSTNRRYKDIS